MTSLSRVDKIYTHVKRMAASFELKPDEKLNETILAERLGTSRTPLREALNRLVSEGFLTFQKGRGFSCRSLKASEIQDLYQAREAIECKLVELACERSRKSDLNAVLADLAACQDRYHEDIPAEDLVKLDEQFHMQIARLSQNQELMRMLDNLNARVRYVRSIDLDERRTVTPGNHIKIVSTMIDGDIPAAVSQMRTHIVRSSHQASEAVRKAYGRIYATEISGDNQTQ